MVTATCKTRQISLPTDPFPFPLPKETVLAVNLHLCRRRKWEMVGGVSRV
jgi:hypothetical protein